MHDHHTFCWKSNPENQNIPHLRWWGQIIHEGCCRTNIYSLCLFGEFSKPYCQKVAIQYTCINDLIVSELVSCVLSVPLNDGMWSLTPMSFNIPLIKNPLSAITEPLLLSKFWSRSSESEVINLYLLWQKINQKPWGILKMSV
jgi:hypothetical protein